jgi:hypothetical protein
LIQLPEQICLADKHQIIERSSIGDYDHLTRN